jgi:hypothetical protein
MATYILWRHPAAPTNGHIRVRVCPGEALAKRMAGDDARFSGRALGPWRPAEEQREGLTGRPADPARPSVASGALVGR